jgi:DNA-binding response OmpR family regulator
MSQKKILIIEDSPELADSLEDMLRFKGYEAIKAINGKQGVALATFEKPDLILLDLKLPDIEGFDVFRLIRADDWGKSARILILTASDTSENIPDDIIIAPDDILHKSQWGIENLAARIESEILK